MAVDERAESKDLKGKFEEVLSEFSLQVAEIGSVMHPDDMTDIRLYESEVTKTAQRLVDIVSETVMFDPH